MISQSYPKLVKGLILIVILIAIVIPDVVFGFLFELFHTLMDFLLHLADILLEGIESTLDTLVEGMLGTGLHETQVIVFYIMLFAGFYGLYLLLRLVPVIYQRLKIKLLSSWEMRKIRTILYWRELSPADKIKLIAICIAGITGYILFGF